jgi:DNA polymerase-3 subunit delta
MKFTAAKVQGFISKPEAGFAAALIYGPDDGQVALLAKQLEKNITNNSDDPFAVTDLSVSRIYQTPSIVADEMSAISFYMGRRVIKILNVENSQNIRIEGEEENSSKNVRNVESFVVEAIENAFDIASPETLQNCFLIVTAGDLKPASGLRAYFEKQNNAAALPCYADDEKQLEVIIANELRAQGIMFDTQVPKIIEHACRGNRLTAINEVAKIKMFLGDKNKISADEADDMIGVTAETSIQDVCNLVVDGEIAKLQRTLAKAFEENNLPIVLIRSVQRYLERLNVVVGNVLQGQSEQDAVNAVRPPIFYKQVPVFKRQVSRWRAKGEKGFMRAYTMLYDAELECKKQGVNQELIVSHFFSRIAQI